MQFWGEGALLAYAFHLGHPRGLSLTSHSSPFLRVSPGECLVTGQSHFKSFDNRYFTFSGICQYLLARDCQDHSFSIVIETVQVSFASPGGWSGGSPRCCIAAGLSGQPLEGVDHCFLCTREVSSRLELARPSSRNPAHPLSP